MDPASGIRNVIGLPRIAELLEEALDKSTCYKHPVGAVIKPLYAPDFFGLEEIFILGWNGAPSRGEEHLECSRKGYASGEGMHLCPSVHAERRAIAYAARDGISINRGSIYMSEWFPCADCAKSIIEAGLTELITPDEVYLDKEHHLLVPKLQDQPYNFEMAEKLIREAGIEIIVAPEIKLFYKSY
ncbi:hypothetical protein JW949_03905 [Candidatus Woesearchaeota archaeon]|nr:hypothetical protein [Candidatus Woesearchaeota archaeon]